MAGLFSDAGRDGEPRGVAMGVSKPKKQPKPPKNAKPSWFYCDGEVTTITRRHPDWVTYDGTLALESEVSQPQTRGEQSVEEEASGTAD